MSTSGKHVIKNGQNKWKTAKKNYHQNEWIVEKQRRATKINKYYGWNTMTQEIYGLTLKPVWPFRCFNWPSSVESFKKILKFTLSKYY